MSSLVGHRRMWPLPQADRIMHRPQEPEQRPRHMWKPQQSLCIASPPEVESHVLAPAEAASRRPSPTEASSQVLCQAEASSQVLRKSRCLIAGATPSRCLIPSAPESRSLIWIRIVIRLPKAIIASRAPIRSTGHTARAEAIKGDCLCRQQWGS